MSRKEYNNKKEKGLARMDREQVNDICIGVILLIACFVWGLIGF